MGAKERIDPRTIIRPEKAVEFSVQQIMAGKSKRIDIAVAHFGEHYSRIFSQFGFPLRSFEDVEEQVGAAMGLSIQGFHQKIYSTGESVESTRWSTTNEFALDNGCVCGVEVKSYIEGRTIALYIAKPFEERNLRLGQRIHNAITKVLHQL